MRITSVSHVSTLPFPMASPALAREGTTSYLVGQGLVRVTPGAAPETLIAPGQGVPMDAGVEVDYGVVTIYGGHEEGDERGTMNTIVELDTDAADIPYPVSALPFPRRGLLAVEHGGKTVLFGGTDERGYTTRDVWVSKDASIRPLNVRLPSSGSMMQGGRTRAGLYLLGSGTDGWDMLAYQDGAGRPAVSAVQALSPEFPLYGVAVAQDGPDAFFFLGGRDDRRASVTLWHYTEDRGTERVGTLALGDEPWAISHAAAWVDGDSVVIAGGTRWTASGGPSGGLVGTPEARVIRVGVERT